MCRGVCQKHTREKGKQMHLNDRQLAVARKLARTDYEVRGLLAAYEAGVIEQDGFTLLLEEIGEAS